MSYPGAMAAIGTLRGHKLCIFIRGGTERGHSCPKWGANGKAARLRAGHRPTRCCCVPRDGDTPADIPVGQECPRSAWRLRMVLALPWELARLLIGVQDRF